MHKSLSIVIPCFNEQMAAPNVLSDVRSVRERLIQDFQFDHVQVIVVDDASNDKSAEICRGFDFVDLISSSTTQGYGESLKRGFRQATGQWICFFDMDGTYPVNHIPHMWENLVRSDSEIVVGKRSLRARGMSSTRGLGNWMFTTLSSSLLRVETKDVCSGFRLFKRERLPEILSISESTLGFSLHMSILFSQKKFKTHDFEIDYLPRAGDSKLSVWKDGWSFLYVILRSAARVHLGRS